MEDDLAVVPPPRQVYRIARRGRDPFAPPPWEKADPDGTFGNRFDDPSAEQGHGPSQRFRAIYCASSAMAAFGEVLARFRPNPRLLARLKEVVDDEPVESSSMSFVNARDLRVGVVPAEWRLGRVLAVTELSTLLRLVDIAAPRTLQSFRRTLAAELVDVDLQDFDLSTATGPNRRLTQLSARHVYDLTDVNGIPLFDGIRYLSRLNPAWECWAVFSNRMQHETVDVIEVFPDNPDLMAICELFALRLAALDD